jgi:hypothetical protein
MKNVVLNLILMLVCVFSQTGCSTLEAETPNPSRTDPSAITETDGYKPNGNIQMTLTVVDSKIVLNQPIILKFLIKNETEKTIKLDLGRNYKEAFEFSIVFPDGARTRLPRIRRGGFASKGVVEVKSSQVYEQDILLNEWITPNQVGTYVLTGEINSPIDASNERSLQIDAHFSVTFKIEPEDSDWLKQISQVLLKRIANSNSSAEAALNARALTYVRNPVVTPYLQEALTAHRRVDWVIINSLKEIGSAEGIEVLINAVETTPDSELALQATNALKWIELQTPDPKQRKRIRQYLKN